MFELPDDLITENHFWLVAVIVSRGLTIVATTEFFVKKYMQIYLENTYTLIRPR